jgi:hypothetical protein
VIVDNVSASTLAPHKSFAVRASASPTRQASRITSNWKLGIQETNRSYVSTKLTARRTICCQPTPRAQEDNFSLCRAHYAAEPTAGTEMTEEKMP